MKKKTWLSSFDLSFFFVYVVVVFFFGGGLDLILLYGVVFRRTLQNISSSAQIIHHIIMAFTKAFYEQAFERNLKAQTTTTTTTRQHADIVPTMTHTQRATTTAMFTAHSKKEVVRQIYIAFFFVCVRRIYMRFELFVEIWGARERSDGWFPRRARETSEEVVFTRRGNDLDARATSRDALCAR